MADDEIDLEEREAQYEKRNGKLQHVIDVLASYETTELDEFGAKSEIAREHDIERHRIDYVLNHWPGLVEYRRFANRDPLDPDAVKDAYEDETLQAMAGRTEAVADGAGSINVSVEFTLDEVFRAIKLLPGDLGLKVYSQTLSADIPHDQIQQILESDN